MRPRSRLLAATMRTSTVIVCVLPTGRISFASMARSSFRLEPEGHVADLVEEDGACHHLLARAALPRDEHRALRRSDLLDELEHLAHGAARADHSLEIVLRLDLATEHLRLPRELPELEQPLDLGEHVVEHDRL